MTTEESIQLKSRGYEKLLFPITKSELVKFKDGSTLDEKLNSIKVSTSWENIENKPLKFPPSEHNHDDLYLKKNDSISIEWRNVTNKPSTFTPSEHNHDTLYLKKSDNVNWNNIVNKPSSFVPASHNHDNVYLKKTDSISIGWSGITGKPAAFPPSEHNHDTLYLKKSDSIDWSKVTNRPSTFAPSSHTHSEYAASNHNHDSVYLKKNVISDTTTTTTNVWSATKVNQMLSSHTHSGYAASNHTHSGYAASNHTHSGYAASNHNHEGTYHPYGGNGSVKMWCDTLEAKTSFLPYSSSIRPPIGSSSHKFGQIYCGQINSDDSIYCGNFTSNGAGTIGDNLTVKGARVPIGSSYARLDCGGSTTHRVMADYSPDYAVRIMGSGYIDFVFDSSQVHQFRENGTKSGGSIELNGTTFGMSPIDSPQTLIEDILFDINVMEEGTIIKLDNIFKQAISTYAVFPSNGKCEITSKDYDSFSVKGFTGKVDFRIVGKRIGEEDSYFPQLVNFDATTDEERDMMDAERETTKLDLNLAKEAMLTADPGPINPEKLRY